MLRSLGRCRVVSCRVCVLVCECQCLCVCDSVRTCDVCTQRTKGGGRNLSICMTISSKLERNKITSKNSPVSWWRRAKDDVSTTSQWLLRPWWKQDMHLWGGVVGKILMCVK